MDYATGTPGTHKQPSRLSPLALPLCSSNAILPHSSGSLKAHPEWKKLISQMAVRKKLDAIQFKLLNVQKNWIDRIAWSMIGTRSTHHFSPSCHWNSPRCPPDSKVTLRADCGKRFQKKMSNYVNYVLCQTDCQSRKVGHPITPFQQKEDMKLAMFRHSNHSG